MPRTAIPPRRILRGIAIVLASAAAGLVISAWLQDGRPGGHSSAPAPIGRRTPVRYSARDARAADPLAGRSLIARARHGRLRVYRHPRGGRVTRVLRPRRIEGQSVPIVLLATSHRPGWVHVRLPTRPNLSTGWVRRRDVDLAATSLRVKVHLRRHRVALYDRRTVLLRATIAVGKALSPTPTGHYFVTDILRTPDPKGFYGPYSLGLSAYSPVYTSFAGGHGQVGLHGTNDPSKLGGDVSHGCIRLSNVAITRLARTLPLGTPVDIVH